MQKAAPKKNMMMRACPRCGGDLYRDMLEVEEEFVCLQCGRRAGVAGPPVAIREHLDEEKEWRSVA